MEFIAWYPNSLTQNKSGVRAVFLRGEPRILMGEILIEL